MNQPERNFNENNRGKHLIKIAHVSELNVKWSYTHTRHIFKK